MRNKFLIVANVKQNPLPKYDFDVPKSLDVAVAPQLDEINAIRSGFIRASQNVNNNAQELEDLGVKYCLVGHSYYRNNFGETNETCQQKINQLDSVGIIPILCARNLQEIVPAPIIMFEPEEAISTNGQYHPESPEKINEILETFPRNSRLLYGGSINENFKFQTLNFKLCSGFVIGHACLNPQEFFAIIKKCSLAV